MQRNFWGKQYPALKKILLMTYNTKKKVFHRYMWGKKFLTPEVWEKIIISTKSRIHPFPTNVQWSCQPFRGLARVLMLRFSRLKFCISRLKKRRWKIQMKREIQWNAQFPFCGQTKAFRYEVVFRGIKPRFYTADRSAWFVFNQGSEVSEETWGTFCTLWLRKYVFKREFLYL